jgi:hypothetical protein
MRLWKLLGVAGCAGVAATGAVLVRHERHRRAYSPDDVRDRLHNRATAVTEEAATTIGADPDLVPDWPVMVGPPERHPMEALLSRVMAVGKLVRR